MWAYSRASQLVSPRHTEPQKQRPKRVQLFHAALATRQLTRVELPLALSLPLSHSLMSYL